MSEKNGWDILTETGGGSSNDKVSFASTPIGITKIRPIDSTPFARWSHWIPSAKRSITCPGKGCPVCELIKQAKANGETPKYNSSRKFSINILNRTTGAVEILEKGKTVFEDLYDLHEEFGDITGYDIKVKRKGDGKDTTYRLDKDADVALTEEEVAMIEANKVNLEEYFKVPTNEQILELIGGADPVEVFKSVTLEVE